MVPLPAAGSVVAGGLTWRLHGAGSAQGQCLAAKGFTLLQELAAKPGAPAEAKRLLEVPGSVVTGLTHYSFDPAPMMEHRGKVGGMIERLTK